MKFTELQEKDRLGAVIRMPGFDEDKAIVTAVKRELLMGITTTTYRLNWQKLGGQLSNVHELAGYDVVSSGGVLYRPQNGSLSDSMDKATVFSSMDYLKKHLALLLEDDDGEMEIKQYAGFDGRIGWNTGIVTWNGAAVGFIHLRAEDKKEEA